MKTEDNFMEKSKVLEQRKESADMSKRKRSEDLKKVMATKVEKI